GRREVGGHGQGVPDGAETLGAVVAARERVADGGEFAQVGQAADLGDAVAERRHQAGAGAGADGHDAGGAGGPVPGGEHLDDGVHQVGGDVGVVAGEQVAQAVAPADVGEAAQGAAGLGLEVDAAGDAEVVLDAGRPHAARLQVHAGAVEAVAGPGGGLGGDAGGPVAAGAVVAAAAGGRRGGVQLAAEELLPAGGGRDVVEHRLLLAAPFGGDPLVAFAVVLPRHAGGRPAALDAADRAVHVEDLEHHLEAGPAEVDQRFERAGGQRAA